MTDGSVRYLPLLMLILSAGLVQALVVMSPRFDLHRFRIGSTGDAVNVVMTWAAVTPIVGLLNYFAFGRPVTTLAFIAAVPLVILLMLGVRLLWAVGQEFQMRAEEADRRRVLVFGAGEGAEQIIRSMRRDPQCGFVPVGMLDDRPERRRRSYHGVSVMGTRSDLERVAKELDAEVLLIAIPSANSTLIRHLSDEGRAAGLEIRVLPPTSELLGMLQVDDIREPTEADLLGRDEVEVDLEAISHYITGKRVLVTGAGGSIGSELCRQLYRLAPSELMMLDRDESALHSLQLSIEGRALLDTPELIVADIRDADRMDEIFGDRRPEVVFHAAALKHLTLLENHPAEGVKTNVHGTNNLLEAARRHGVARFVNVSTDKAADPTSVLGATKLVAERLTSRMAQRTGLPYVSVRFGNVLGSRGSVLPTFKSQIAHGGPLTVTHPDVTRYFMTIPEAVRLVLQAGAIGEPGEIMILDMGDPVRIADLAEQLIRLSGKNIEITYTGLRPGEKLDEILIAADEVGVVRSHARVTHTPGKVDLPAICDGAVAGSPLACVQSLVSGALETS
ncbi:MAG: polysaccharide biosynthesis protein [Acidimicrobiales bacterium]